jgi:hypothetical protein
MCSICLVTDYLYKLKDLALNVPEIDEKTIDLLRNNQWGQYKNRVQ